MLRRRRLSVGDVNFAAQIFAPRVPLGQGNLRPDERLGDLLELRLGVRGLLSRGGGGGHRGGDVLRRRHRIRSRSDRGRSRDGEGEGGDGGASVRENRRSRRGASLLRLGGFDSHVIDHISRHISRSHVIGHISRGVASRRARVGTASRGALQPRNRRLRELLPERPRLPFERFFGRFDLGEFALERLGIPREVRSLDERGFRGEFELGDFARHLRQLRP